MLAFSKTFRHSGCFYISGFISEGVTYIYTLLLETQFDIINLFTAYRAVIKMATTRKSSVLSFLLFCIKEYFVYADI